MKGLRGYEGSRAGQGFEGMRALLLLSSHAPHAMAHPPHPPFHTSHTLSPCRWTRVDAPRRQLQLALYMASVIEAEQQAKQRAVSMLKVR